MNLTLRLLLLSFVLMAACTSLVAAPNLAFGKAATADDTYGSCGAPENGACLPSYAVDGILGTHWSAGSSGLHWLQVDLADVYSISKVKLVCCQSGQFSGMTMNYDLYRSLDASSWTPVVQNQLMTEPASVTHEIGVGGNAARYIKLQTTGGTHWGHLYEMEVYGTAVPEPVSCSLVLFGLVGVFSARRLQGR